MIYMDCATEGELVVILDMMLSLVQLISESFKGHGTYALPAHGCTLHYCSLTLYLSLHFIQDTTDQSHFVGVRKQLVSYEKQHHN